MMMMLLLPMTGAIELQSSVLQTRDEGEAEQHLRTRASVSGQRGGRNSERLLQELWQPSIEDIGFSTGGHRAADEEEDTGDYQKWPY